MHVGALSRFILARPSARTGAHEKSVHRLAERKGFRLDKVGKGQHRFSMMDVGSGGKVSSGVAGHEFSFTLEEAEAWLATREDVTKGKS
jgi:hypothetical protein